MATEPTSPNRRPALSGGVVYGFAPNAPDRMPRGGPEIPANPSAYLDPVGQRIALEILADTGIKIVAAAADNDSTEWPFFPAAFGSAATPDKTNLSLNDNCPGYSPPGSGWVGR